MPANRRHSCRHAFTMVEVTVALAVIAVAGVIIAQAVTISLHERAQSAVRQAALELAANVLESARAAPFETLNEDWAKNQQIPSEMPELLRGGSLTVTVSPGTKAANAKLIAVEVSWPYAEGQPLRSVRLTTVISPREAKSAGGAP